jgi:hypothetical protein
MASSKKKLAVLAWAVGVAAIAVLFLGAIAGPKFMTFQTRAQQSEAKTLLKRLYFAEREHLKTQQGYGVDARALDVRFEAGNRFTYFLGEGPGQVIASDVAKTGGPAVRTVAETHCPITPGVDGEGRSIPLGVTPGPKGGFVFLAAKRSPSGDGFDCWTIASMDRVRADGQTIAAGVPFGENDAAR